MEDREYFERIDKIISSCGLMSRKDVKKAVHEGRITVDGVKAKSVDIRLSEKNLLMLDNKPIMYNKYVYIMLNKPSGYVCSTDEPGQKTVFELLKPPHSEIELFVAGRLDKDTTGFTLLTNDGSNAHRLLSPAHHVEKHYEFRCADKLTVAALESISSGIELADGYKTKPCTIIPDRDMQGGIIILTEGKYHQIKRMLGAVGNRITALKRTKYGNVALDPSLSPGEYRLLTKDEIEILLKK